MLPNHKHSNRNKEEINRSSECGCVFCCTIFTPDKIIEWVDNSQTAICPHCNVDSVIGDGSGLPITVDFLIDMYRRWFML